MAIKRCPTCNQEFTDEWLTFCTNDGTSLVPVEGPSEEPPPTVVSMPPSVSPLEQPTMHMPGAVSTQPPTYRPPQSLQPGLAQQGWSPPPPPPTLPVTEKNLALVSLILGVVSITIGWCCYFGVLTAPIAIGLGIYALSLIKKEPNKYGGRGLAIGGIVTGSFYFLFVLIIIVIYGLGFFMSALGAR